MQSLPLFRSALVCVALAFAAPALAQDDDALPPGPLVIDGATAGEADEGAMPGEGVMTGGGEPYVAATHRDWQILCNRFGEEEQEFCEMYQLLETEDGPIAEISIAALPEGSEFQAGATITTPLETFLPTGVLFRINAGETRQQPFVVCTVVGCIVRMGLSEEDITAMQRGANAFVTISAIVAPNQPIEIPTSLLGFTAAMDDLRERMPAE